MAGAGKRQKIKKANKHASNIRRRDRKYGRPRGDATGGKCGSSFCDRKSGCVPWQ